jgi:hypothetical protein
MGKQHLFQLDMSVVDETAVDHGGYHIYFKDITGYSDF